jgi:hypothetical protein
MKSRARSVFHPGFGLIHPALLRFQHNQATFASVAESESAHAEIKHMSKCLSVHIPQGSGKSSGLSASGCTAVGLALGRTAQDSARLSRAHGRTGRRGTEESAPLILTLFRALSTVVQWFRALPKSSDGDLLLHDRLESHLQSVAVASDLGSALVTTVPGRDRHRQSFRGAWAQTKSGARFERKRLMRMTHQAGF